MTGRPRKPRSAALPVPVTAKKGSDEYWLQTLPRPPRPIGEATDSIAAHWMRQVYEAGGMEGLTWAWQPDHWPYGPTTRGRMFHIYGELQREDEARAKAAARAAAQQQQDQLLRDRHDAFAKAGWR